MNSIVQTVPSLYVVRLKLPNCDTEEISGCDSADRDEGVRLCKLVERWLHGGVLYADLLPRGTLRDVFGLRKHLRRRGIDRFAVRVECVQKDRTGHRVAWPETEGAWVAPDGDDDTALEVVEVVYAPDSE